MVALWVLLLSVLKGSDALVYGSGNVIFIGSLIGALSASHSVGMHIMTYCKTLYFHVPFIFANFAFASLTQILRAVNGISSFLVVTSLLFTVTSKNKDSKAKNKSKHKNSNLSTSANLPNNVKM